MSHPECIYAFLQITSEKPYLLSAQDWQEMRELFLSKDFPKDNEQAVALLENWLSSPGREKLLAAYREHIDAIATEQPLDLAQLLKIVAPNLKTIPGYPVGYSEPKLKPEIEEVLGDYLV